MKRLIRKQPHDLALIAHAGPHTVYAAVLYREEWVEDVVIGAGKIEKAHTTKFAIGPALHSFQITNPERARYFHTLVSTAANLNRMILATVELEELEKRELKAKAKKARKKK
jgi:hypothetical protein